MIPDRVTVGVKLDGASATEQSYAVAGNEETPNAAEITVRIEPTRIPRDFQFRVRGNDADTGWQTVHVHPPPVLVPLDGRPSPQIHLDYPAYTDLPPADLPDGSGAIECIAGTRVHIRAATDRPVARAWLGFRPEQPLLRILPALSPLGANSETSSAGLQMLAEEVWADVPVTIGRDGTLLEVDFVPRMSGPYAFRFEDDTGLGTTRMFAIVARPDPAPIVTVERPSSGRDSLLVLPDAEITFEAKVVDTQYAIRAVPLEYRTNRQAAIRSFPWFDADLAGRVMPATGSFMRGPIPIPPSPPLRLRPQELTFANRLSLAQIRHADDTPLIAGDVVTIQIAADDFDDVTGFKQPGRSHEVELIVVARQDLEAVEQQAQSDLRAELLRLHAQQREARTRVQEAIQQLRNTGKLSPDDFDKLNRAEQAQQQIRQRINNPEDGLRAQLDKLRQSAKDNHLPRSATTQRLDEAAAELARLVREELEPLELDLGAARRPNDTKESPVAPLTRAEKRQKEVEQTMLSLLERLEPWSGAGEIRGEARSVLNDTRRQIENNNKLGAKLPTEAQPDKLTPEQKAELDRAAVNDDRLAERGRQLVEKMNRLAVEKDAAAQAKLDLANAKDAEAAAKRAEAKQNPAGSPEQKSLGRQADDLTAEAKQSREAAADLKREADALRNAATAGNAEQLKDQLRNAGQFTRQNQTSQATASQRAAAANLEKMLNALEEQQADDNDRLTRRFKDADKQLDELIEKQERLQKKVEDAEALKDPMQRTRKLEKLSREQEKLETDARDLAQRLSRNQGERAAEELRRAAREMERAREQLESGDARPEKMDDVLDRLDDAQRELDEARQKNDEELQREQAAKFADELKALREREQRLLDESIRIHAVVKKSGKWERPVRTSLNDLREQQQVLAGEVRRSSRRSSRTPRSSAACCVKPPRRWNWPRSEWTRSSKPPRSARSTKNWKTSPNAGVLGQQKLSLKRLDQLLESLKPDKQDAAPPPPMAGGMPPDMPPPMGGRPGDGLPPLAQLKALRSLQADIGERTAAFDQAHPDRTKLNDDEVAELELLQKMQLDVAELIKELTSKMEM